MIKSDVFFITKRCIFILFFNILTKGTYCLANLPTCACAGAKELVSQKSISWKPKIQWLSKRELMYTQGKLWLNTRKTSNRQDWNTTITWLVTPTQHTNTILSEKARWNSAPHLARNHNCMLQHFTLAFFFLIAQELVCSSSTPWKEKVTAWFLHPIPTDQHWANTRVTSINISFMEKLAIKAIG